MNIVNKLTLRHMKENKRRTLVTILGVIISVSMITAVTTLGLSFLDVVKRDVIANEGNWHLKYTEVSIDKLEVLKESPYASELLIDYEEGYALLSEQGLEGNANKPYIHVTAYNEAAFDKLPLKLLDGRLPQGPNEIVVPEHFLTHFNKDAHMIGETMTMTLGERYNPDQTIEGSAVHLNQNYSIIFDEDRTTQETFVADREVTYTVVGIIERLNWEYGSSPGYSFLAGLDLAALPQDATVTARLYAAKPDKHIFKEGELLGKESSAKTYEANSSLLRYQFVSSHDGFIATLYSLLAIVMGVIMVGSISLIYNAFGISVADRSRNLGMLASVGATRRQKRNSVFFEGLCISIISIPIGILGGLAGLAITFAAINPTTIGALGLDVGFEVKMNLWTLLLTIGISLITVLLSVWWPAKRAAKVSAIEAIRQTQDVKMSRKQVKTSKLVRKLFGIEADIALKNIKRNKRRYQITVFSLVISIILFLTVSYLTQSMKQALFSSNSGVNYDIQIYYSEKDDPNIKALIGYDGIKEYNLIQAAHSYAHIPSQYVPELNISAIMGEQGERPEDLSFNIHILALQDEQLRSIAEQAGVDASQLFDTSHPQAILYNTISYYHEGEKRFVSEKVLTQATDLMIQLVDTKVERVQDENGEIGHIVHEVEGKSLELVGSTEVAPLGVIRGGFKEGANRLTLYVSQAVIEELGNNSELYVGDYNIYITSDNPLALEEEIRKSQQFDNYYIRNVFKDKKEEESTMFIVSVFSYGFISLITLISIANILNTISTSIQLRRREFAMLRSIGMTEKGFYRMINYESILYGVKSLLYGLPISFIVMLLIYRSMLNTSYYPFQVPWLHLGILFVALFIIVGMSMMYSGSKVKKGSIVDAIKQENM